ncbi:reverse transcriptase domain-containing protein [Tanacetum coccineum]
MPQDALKIIENKSKVRNSRNKPIVSQANASEFSSSEMAKLTNAVTQQTSVVTSAMTATMKQLQATTAPASVKAVEESSAAVNYNQGNIRYHPQGDPNFRASNQMGPPAPIQNQFTTSSDLEKFKKTNEASMQAMRNHIINLKSELRNEMQSTMQNQNNALRNEMQATMSNQTNELKNMMASFFQMNAASSSGSGSLPSNTIANPRGELKAIATRSSVSYDGPYVPIPPPFINPEENEREEETSTDPKMLKELLSNKEKLVELANTPLSENCSAVILKKLPEKLGDPGKFLIPCLPEFIPTRMTLELANRIVCTPARIARDVFVPVGKFTFPADFLIVDYIADARIPLILGRPFLRTAHALIDVHEEVLILRDSNERLILNMKHNTSIFSDEPQEESINMIDIYDVSYKDYLEDLFANKKITNNPESGNPTPISDPIVSSSSPTHTSLDRTRSSLIEELLNNDLSSPLPFSHKPLSGSTTSFSPSLIPVETSDTLLEEFADKLALLEPFPLGIGDDDFDPDGSYFFT